MYILISSYLTAREKVEPFFKAHCEWLTKYIKKGVFIASGPKKNQLGGAILVSSIEKNLLDEILAEDSYTQENLAEYLIVEVDIKSAGAGFEKLIGS